MIKEEVLSEKLKYLIMMNTKPKMFEVMNIYIEFEYDGSHEKLEGYDIDIKFDYEGGLDFDMYPFTHDIKIMSEKLRDILSEYVITQDGKIVSGGNSNCYSSGDPIIFKIEYEADMKHIFELGYKFRYAED
jgi:hypothetical protein